MNETGDRTPNGGEIEEDDLLRTIRQMVSDEASRPDAQPEPAPAPQPVAPAAHAQEFGMAEAPAAAPVPPSAPQALTPERVEAQPLVLGAMARVESNAAAPRNGQVRRGVAPSGRISANDPALRSMITNIVRDEIKKAMTDTLRPQISELLRSELTDMLASRGSNPKS